MDRRKLHTIRLQPLSTLVTNALVCSFCSIVDRDTLRMTVGYPCPCCGHPSKGGCAYFPIAAHAMVDLMQANCHYDPPTRSPLSGDLRIGTLVYFTAFIDVLLEHFLRVVMTAKGVPGGEQDATLMNNLTRKRRMRRVFASVVGTTFPSALRQLAQSSRGDFNPVVEFCREVADKRNDIVHEGVTWQIPPTLPYRCLDESLRLAQLFIELHNEFVFPIYRGSGNAYRWPA